MWTEGGVVKMSMVASERIKRTEGLNWQPSEEDEQAAVMEWTVLMEKQLPELRLLFHIANGGERHPAVAQKLKKAGVKKGVPDLFLPVARGGFHGLWIEMKRKKGGRVSDEQKQWIADLEGEMYRCFVAHGAEEACGELFRYLTEAEQ